MWFQLSPFFRYLYPYSLDLTCLIPSIYKIISAQCCSHEYLWGLLKLCFEVLWITKLLRMLQIHIITGQKGMGHLWRGLNSGWQDALSEAPRYPWKQVSDICLCELSFEFAEFASHLPWGILTQSYNHPLLTFMWASSILLAEIAWEKASSLMHLRVIVARSTWVPKILKFWKFWKPWWFWFYASMCGR
jgi:hypothetical protein